MMTVLLLLYMCVLIALLLKSFHKGFAFAIGLDLLVVRKGFLDLGIHLPFREVIFLIVILFFIYHSLSSTDIKLVIKGRFLSPILIFLFVTILILFFSENFDTAAQIKHIIGLIYYLIYAYIAWVIYTDQNKIEDFYRYMFVIAMSISIYGLFTYLFKSNPYLTNIFGDDLFHNYIDIEDRGALGMRVQSTMIHPITWGASCALFFMFYFRQCFKNKLKNILFILLIPNVLLSGSRAAILMLILFFVFLFIWGDKKIKKHFFKIAILSVLFFIIILQIPVFHKYQGIIESTLFFWDESVARDNEITGSSTTMRLLQYLGVLDIIKDHLLFGIGHGYVNFYLTTYGQHPILLGFESLVFNKLVEGGVIGLFIWIYLFFILFKKTNLLKAESNKFDLSVLKGYVVSYFVFVLLTGFIDTFQLFVILYILQYKQLLVNKNT